jgi:S1-C subfamily serine protease
VIRAGGKDVREADDLRQAVDAAKPGSEIDLTVQRDGRAVELKVKLREAEPLRRRRTTSTF